VYNEPETLFGDFLMTPENDAQILARMKAHPTLRKRFEAILDIAENTSGDLITADEAEGKAIEEVKKLGQEILTEWAVNQHEKAIKATNKEHPAARNHTKKNSIGNRHLEE
jgi:hypothetical protein